LLVKPSRISDEDRALFRAAVGPVTPLRQDKVSPLGEQPRPHPAQTLVDQQRVLQESLSGNAWLMDSETGEELVFLRPGVQRRLLTRLRRGHFSIEAELDLHGMTTAVAHHELGQFLRHAKIRGIRCVRIIHGKGLRSPNGRSVLKAKVERWLRLRDEIVAFTSARPVDGGTGAIYVLLKRQ
jgi:DNA-nicking Smr family endonuclease